MAAVKYEDGKTDSEAVKAVVRVITARIGSFDSGNVNWEDAYGKKLIAYAAGGDSFQIFTRLLELGADPMVVDRVRTFFKFLNLLICLYRSFRPVTNCL